ncbi:hypothetical protein JR316_0000646 [Psilocybe cubensis]|uniref:Uncharacterized protein n=2 Tax=Psilocybe cubensis TaxID=181762 RepID=A0A8H8CQJ3_PSICU|nr:hypothetical protein JR316_0000646 [Psilocybe cubensis]KAH9486581.1 hypothetical protein JR316_0000646 [Psilocybe cubensis]
MDSNPPAQHVSSITSPSSTLKRCRSSDRFQRKFNPACMPPLPPVQGDLILQVYTHKSLRRPNVPPAVGGDNEVLSTLGRPVFEVALTHCLFRRRPFLNASQISKSLEILLSSSMIDDWVKFYKLRTRLLCHPSVFPSLQLPEETRSLFYAYVGALFLSSGVQAVDYWVASLIQQELHVLPHALESEADAKPQAEIPAPKRAKSELPFALSSAMAPPIFFASQPPPSPPLPSGMRHAAPSGLPPKPAPPTNKPAALPPNPMAPAQPNLPFLPLFKQAAAQRRVTVDYLAEFIGPSHAGQWVVKCIVNGIFKGEGTGGSKQLAKEDAARKAYYSMGWT